jgi:hypothetical protein
MSTQSLVDRVGHYIPSGSAVDSIKDAIRVIRSEASQMGPALTTKERARLLRVREGSESTTDLILRLADDEALNSRVITTEGVRKDLALAKLLEPLLQDAGVAYRLLSDIHRQAKSEYWGGAMVFYRLLAARASSESELEARLRPVVSFMATGPRAKGENAAAKPGNKR